MEILYKFDVWLAGSRISRLLPVLVLKFGKK